MENINEGFECKFLDENGELQSRIGAEFEEYRKDQLEGLRQEGEKFVREKGWKRGELDSLLASRREKYEKMNVWGRIAELVNNLHFWFPGGWYRQLLEERKKDKVADPNKIASDEQLIRDLDELIRMRGYGSSAEGIAKQEGVDKETRLKILADIYLKMRDKGYDRSRLAR